jgi:hypothetical protein
VKVFDSILFLAARFDHVFHARVKDVVLDFLCVDLACHCCEEGGKKSV